MRMVLEGQQEAGARNQMLLLRWKVIAMATLTETQNKKGGDLPFTSSSLPVTVCCCYFKSWQRAINRSIQSVWRVPVQHHKGAFKRVDLEVKGNSLIFCTCAYMRTHHQREFHATVSVLQLFRVEMFSYWAPRGLPTALGYGRSFG